MTTFMLYIYYFTTIKNHFQKIKASLNVKALLQSKSKKQSDEVKQVPRAPGTLTLSALRGENMG